MRHRRSHMGVEGRQMVASDLPASRTRGSVVTEPILTNSRRMTTYQRVLVLSAAPTASKRTRTRNGVMAGASSHLTRSLVFFGDAMHQQKDVLFEVGFVSNINLSSGEDRGGYQVLPDGTTSTIERRPVIEDPPQLIFGKTVHFASLRTHMHDDLQSPMHTASIVHDDDTLRSIPTKSNPYRNERIGGNFPAPVSFNRRQKWLLGNRKLSEPAGVQASGFFVGTTTGLDGWYNAPTGSDDAPVRLRHCPTFDMRGALCVWPLWFTRDLVKCCFVH